MDKGKKKQWDKMVKDWEETRDIARSAAARDAARDEKIRAIQARVEQAHRATMKGPPPERPRSNNPIPDVPTERSPQLPPEGETPPLCWCGDVCKFFKSKHRISLGMRYWGCANYSSDYPNRRFDTATYRQPVTTTCTIFPYLFSFTTRTNNISLLFTVSGAPMCLPQMDRS